MVVIKKSILLVFFLAISLIVSGTTYYISSTGNDVANGLSEATAWKTTAKVNSAFSTFKPGDKILFRRGDIFYGTINVTVAGSSGNPITIGAYGSGNAPIISGFTTITGWTNLGGGIYSKAVSAQSTPNIVLFDGINQPLGRYPHLTSISGWPSSIPTTTIASRTSITSSFIPSSSTTDLYSHGAEVIIRSAGATNDRCLITGHSGTTITHVSTANDTPPIGAGFFIQNHPVCLTTLGDWRFESGTIYMYFGLSDNPTNHTIKISTVDNLVNISSKSYVTLDGITIEGGNDITVNISNSNYITIQNCAVQYGGKYGIYCNTPSYVTITNNTIDQNNNDGIYLTSATHSTVTHNMVSNSGMILGMGFYGWSVNEGICIDGGSSSNYNLVSYNNINNSGYDGIRWTGHDTEISYNLINHSCQNAADGGGIYSYRGTGANRVVKYNIVLNTMAQPWGWEYPDWTSGNGIYLDGDGGVSILNNILANNQGPGIFINSNQATTAQYNTCYNNSSQIYVLSGPNQTGLDGRAMNHTIRYNTLFAKTANQYCLAVVTINAESDLSLFGIIDYNYYARPINIDNYIFREYSAWSGPNQKINIAKMSSQLGFDTHSTASAITLTDVNKIRFEYNETSSNKVVALDAGYVDAVGTKYSGSITLLPFTALVLMVDPNPAAASAVPKYLGATVEDATPALLQLDYDLAFANVLPAVSSLSVTVNSLAMKVQSLAISGTSVILTLAYEVLYGDVVTVAYTKPSSNLLQSTTGLIVPTMSGQIVKNKVNPNGPVYLSSSIENSAPNILKINFDEIVETSVPGVSSFVVMVNGVKASITSVSISGNTVLLTLAVPVVFGDNITVSYIKPSSNELKKASGETAVSFSSPQPVNNNCTDLAGNSLKKESITIYPNPAREFINISILETSLQPQLLKIFDLSGRLFLESQINPGTINKVLINLKSGIYVVQVVSGSIINFVQKLIVL